MVRLTEKEARAILGDRYPEPEKKRNKYNALKTELDGIVFDSQREAEYYAELKLRLRASEIKGFELQPVFVLQESFIDSRGNKHRALTYRADFRVEHIDGRIEIVDVKGYRTRTYRDKVKLLLVRYPDLWFTEVT